MTTKLKSLPLFDKLEFLERRKLPAHITLNDIEKLEDDYYHAVDFLYSYRGSEATFTAYRRELERFIFWCWYIHHSSFSMLNRSDLETFIEFCQSPPASLIGTKNVARFIDDKKDGKRIINPEWRPFVATVTKSARREGQHADIQKYQLSQKALQAIFAILGSFYSYLIEEGYVQINPVAQVRQKSKFLRKQQHQSPIRRLSELQWQYVIETAELMANKDPETHERTLFIMTALYAMYLRISELVATNRWQPTMGDFYQDHDGNWWFTTVGKGNKQRNITVADAMLNALRRYRQSRGLASLPFPGETTPLLTKNNNKDPIRTTRYIRIIVQRCFDHAIIRLNKDGFHDETEQLKAATVHWLRHTGISDDVKHRPREHVRDDAGHSSGAITDKYIDVERRARHESARRKVINPFKETANAK